MNTQSQRDLTSWLAQATAGLPPEIAVQLQIELTAHYEDAIADHRSRGEDPAVAEALAITDLGDAATVRRRLHQVYLSPVERMVAGALPLLRRLWARRAWIGLGFFGLMVLGVTLMDRQHLIVYRRHLDPVIPLALILVSVGLVTERRLAAWSYPAVGYLIAGLWGALFAGPLASLDGAFWQILAPLLLPVTVLLIGAIAAIREARHHEAFTLPPRAWAWMGLCFLTHLIAATIPITIQAEGGGGQLAEALLSVPIALWRSCMFIAPVFIGLFGARQDGLKATLIPLAVHYSIFVHLVDPTYHLTYYQSWQPTPTLMMVEALVTYLPPLTTFLVTPLWLQAARSKQGRTIALLVPTMALLLLTPILGVLGLAHTFAAYTSTDWLRHGLEFIQVTSALVFAAALYRQYDNNSEAGATARAPQGPYIASLCTNKRDITLLKSLE
jgi:hypothetical protein